MTLQLSSAAIENGSDFPADYTCNGRNVNPPLTISGVPQKSASLVLIFDDPDAAQEPRGNGSTFDHWVVYNIPAVDQKIPENATPTSGELGKNSTGQANYVGPCPPTFRHKYIFRLIALDERLNFVNPPTKHDIENAIIDHIVEEAKLIAYYEQPA